jgi:hypothetical protein
VTECSIAESHPSATSQPPPGAKGMSDMTTEQKIIKNKVGLLELARQLGNVSRACKILGYSRDSFYRFQILSETAGEEALREIYKRKLIVKNRVEPEMEQAIVQLGFDRPAWDQAQVSNDLRRKAQFVSPGGVRNVWLRHDLQTFKLRQKALEAKVTQEGLILTEGQISAEEKGKDEKEAHGEIETKQPSQRRGRGHGHVSGLPQCRTGPSLPGGCFSRPFPRHQAVQRETVRLASPALSRGRAAIAHRGPQRKRWLLLKNCEDLDNTRDEARRLHEAVHCWTALSTSRTASAASGNNLRDRPPNRCRTIGFGGPKAPASRSWSVSPTRAGPGGFSFLKSFDKQSVMSYHTVWPIGDYINGVCLRSENPA